ncbi:MAG TPA: multidrug ABC transporter permease [Bacteroidales bacterium]|nr:MAG: multidrug ABC transporter permease [Bacteroidetes bacterium GWE2_42_24]OFY27299.1 MAG: multidrug ABC transporter permease [Bacteroidetes bacterium GWF2_43_11]HAQ65078.1 multidrug ABC transporter permease [Bacteroidales bacterium]HBZ65955.1 multidrug ABC transporter permease [Bacteroidales bacterium]
MKAFIKKELFHIFRDYRTMLILFGMPVVQVLIFGYAITNEIKDAKVAILDQSGDVLSSRFVSKLTASGYFEVDRTLDHPSQIEPAFREGRVKQVIVIPSGFGTDFGLQKQVTIQILGDASDPNTANMLKTYTMAILNDFQMQELGKQSLPVDVKVEPLMFYNPELKGVYMFVPGTMAIILMLVSAMMTSISIAREKELGTMEVLLVSPLRPWQIIIGKVIPYVALSFINALLILSLGWFVFGVPIIGSKGFLLIEVLLFIIMSLSLGIFISTISPTQQVAMLLSMFALMLPTILLSGFIFPVENMPTVLQWLSNLMPSRWFIIIVRDIMLKGSGIAYLWKETMIIFGMTLFFIGLSIVNFKLRLD